MSGEAGLRSRGGGGGLGSGEEEEARSEVWSFWSVVRDAVSWTEVVVLFSVGSRGICCGAPLLELDVRLGLCVV